MIYFTQHRLWCRWQQQWLCHVDRTTARRFHAKESCDDVALLKMEARAIMKSVCACPKAQQPVESAAIAKAAAAGARLGFSRRRQLPQLQGGATDTASMRISQKRS